METKLIFPDDAGKTTNVQCIFVRHPVNHWWGYFFVHPNYLLVAHTDFGTYAYGWSSGNKDFKDFLLSLNDHYVQEKFSGQDRRVDAFVKHLWPLFIEQLKQEKQAPVTHCFEDCSAIKVGDTVQTTGLIEPTDLCPTCKDQAEAYGIGAYPERHNGPR